MAYQGILRREYPSISEYLKVSRMCYVGTWATELEIQAAADCLGVSVFTYYNDRWLEYSCQGSRLSLEGVYLINVNGNHYNTVVCVHQPQTQNCYSYCKVNTAVSGGYSFRDRNPVGSPVSDFGSVNWVRSDACDFSRKKSNLIRKQSVLRRDYMKEHEKRKYHQNVLYREQKKHESVGKYKDNLAHKIKMKTLSVKKYKDNLAHKIKVKTLSAKQYKENPAHRIRLKTLSVKKYQHNVLHRRRMIELSKSKYLLNKFHKDVVKAAGIRKYCLNRDYRRRVAANVKRNRLLKEEKSGQFDFVVQQFLDKVKDGPEFVCCVCRRLLFRHQVLNCKREEYRKTETVASIAAKCITEDYLHQCCKDCDVPCHWLDTARGKLWICYSCHHKINRGEMPPECWLNNLMVDPVAPELACLNSLEQHLIALHIPFMKMLALPKGGQNGVHGPVTCVPANIVETSNLLPRSNMEGSLLPVKLKRKLTYKGHYEYQFVDSMRIKQALQYLKGTNSLYKDIEFNEAWLNEFCREQEADVPGAQEAEVPGASETVDSADAAAEDELLHDRQQHGMFQDMCLMPVDIGQEVLDQYCDGVLNVAPAEGNNPVKLLSDTANEAKCFPALFPQARNTYHGHRPYRLTLSRYFNNRILHADSRFACNVEYIFYAQYMSEVEQVVSNVSIALGKGGQRSYKVSDILKDEDSLKQMLEFDDGYRFLKPIRGTPAFWQGAQRDLLACVRQLGVPTWFCSFSSADMRWMNLLYSILKQEGRTATVEDLEWAEKCDLLRRNPVINPILVELQG